MMKYTRAIYRSVHELHNYSRSSDNEVWLLAKPLGIRLRDRIQAALLCLKGKAAAIVWE